MQQKGLKKSKIIILIYLIKDRIVLRISAWAINEMSLFLIKKKHPKVLFSSGILAELLLAKSTKTLVEFINTTTSLSSFLLTSVEWVTF